ncbi:MAG: TQO small subunit DoxD [bacterium]|nr:TQO small subunit DoxD [bacterium]
MFENIKANLKEPSYLSYLAFLRITLGIFFFQAGWGKLTSGFISRNMLLTIFNDWVQHVPNAWYKNFLLEYAMPHSTIFSYLVVYGEILVGLALVFGVMTRLSVLLAMIMNLNYHLASGWRPGSGALINKIFLACEIVILLSAAGRSFGIDRILHKKYPRNPLW